MKIRLHSQILGAGTALVCIVLSCCGPLFAQYTETVLHTFNPSKDGTALIGATFVPDGHGNLYGTTMSGGAHSRGTFFELTPRAGHGWRETRLFSFPVIYGDTSSSPSGGLARDSAGNFYGLSPYDGKDKCTSGGYPIGCGTIWKLSHTAQGWHRTILYYFTGQSDGQAPYSLVMDSSGNLYGLSSVGSQGAVFELSPNGADWSFSTLYTFTGGSDGGDPNAVLLDQSGTLLGSTYSGGISNPEACYDYNTNSNGCGVVFELSPATGGTWKETVLYSFLGGADGGNPYGSVTLDPKGNLFGVAEPSQSSAFPLIFEVSHTSGGWTESVPYTFGSYVGPSLGSSDASGNIFGATQWGGLNTCEDGCGTLFELSPVSAGWTFNTLYSFTGADDGQNPVNPALEPKGNVFVATNNPAAGNFGGLGLQIEFELSPLAGGKWKGSVVHDFPSPGDGYNSVASLVRDAAGNLYGTTVAGGADAWGTVFELTPSGGGWKETILYSFRGAADGGLPLAGLALDPSGNLYGTTAFGGDPTCLSGCGSIFKLSPRSGEGWSFSVLHTFRNGKDGSSPRAGVILDNSGNVYGTSLQGTSNQNCFGGCGTVFKLSPTAHGEWTFRLLYGFSGGTGGGEPVSGTIAMDASGNLYGTTEDGGSGGYGVVYELSPRSSGQWKETVLYNVPLSEAYAAGSLVLDHAGNLYGTSEQGGSFNHGQVFELSHSGRVWTKSTIYSFTGGSDGASPVGGVVFDSSGNLFGQTAASAYELTPVGNTWKETTLFSFNINERTPSISLVVDPSGNLFGTIPVEQSSPSLVYELTP